MGTLFIVMRMAGVLSAREMLWSITLTTPQKRISRAVWRWVYNIFMKKKLKKFGESAVLVGRLGKEIAKRTFSQNYTHEQIFGKGFGKKSRKKK